MNQPANSDMPVAEWDPAEAMELWKYFGNVGATDKNTMVSVESLLLGLLATSIAYLGTHLICLDCFQPLHVTQPYRGMLLAVLGGVIAIVAAYVAMLYGGYSNWNWARADAIARAQGHRLMEWEELLPPNSTKAVERSEVDTPGWHCTLARRLGQPGRSTRLAPIFGLFAYLAIGAALVHLLLLVLSVSALARYSRYQEAALFLGVVFVVAAALALFVDRQRRGARKRRGAAPISSM